MLGYIVVEPNLRVDRVPDHLLSWNDLRWPADRNTLPERSPTQSPPAIKPDDLYHRHKFEGSGVVVYVWSKRDPNALPEGVTNEVRERARADAQRT